MAEKLTVLGARGPGLTELARKTGNFGVMPTDSDNQALTKFADAAIQQNPGFKGDRGDPGAANNTYTSYSALLASDPTRQYAYLVGDTDVPAQPDGVFSNPTKTAGAWVRQDAAGITTAPKPFPARKRQVVRKNRERLSILDVIANNAIEDEVRNLTRATAASSSLDLTSYFQEAFDAQRATSGEIFVPDGVYPIANTLTAYGSEDTGSTVLVGQSEYGAVIYGKDSTKPILTNEDVMDFRRLALRNLTLRRGSHAIRLVRTGDQVASLLSAEGVRFEAHGQGAIRCDQYAITWFLNNVVFYYANQAMYCGRNANNLKFVGARCEGMDDDIFEFTSPGGSVNGCEDVKFIGLRVEGRNDPATTGMSIFKGYRLSGLEMIGGYVEDSHRDVLQETGSVGGVAFRGVHFTGAENGVGGSGFKMDRFTSDGVVTLESNRFVTGSAGANKQLLIGVNRGLVPTFGAYLSIGESPVYQTPTISLTSGTATDLVVFSRPPPTFPDEPVGGANQRTIAADVIVSVQARKTDGQRASARLRVPLLVEGFSSEAMRLSVGTVETVKLDTDTILTVTVAPEASPTTTRAALRITATLNNAPLSITCSARLAGASLKGAALTHMEIFS